MKKIGQTIIEKGLTDLEYNKTRQTVRAVIINENKVYMLYSQMFNDYTFPGGGVKHDEDKKEALKRELFEEIGATKVNIIEEIGFTEELRYGLNSNGSTYQQTSYFYLVEVLEKGEPNFVGREKIQGIVSKWVEIDEVIKHNAHVNKHERENEKGFQTVLIREETILKHIKENLL